MLQMARSQTGVNSVARNVKTWLSSVSGFLPWFPFLSSPPSLLKSLFYQKLHNNLRELVSPALGHTLPLTVTIGEGEILALRPAFHKYVKNIF